MSGTAFSQAIPVIASVFLARLYAPNLIGAFSLFVSITSILSIIGTLKFEEAILLPKSDEEGKAIFQLSIILNLSFLFFQLIFILFFNNYLKNFFPSLNNYFYIIPFCVFLINLYQSFLFLSNREKDYKNISISKITQNFCQSLIQLVLYKFLLFGLLFGRILGILTSIFHFTKLFRTNEFFKFNKSKIKTVFQNYRNFALFNTPNAILNQMSNSLPLYFLTLYYDLSYAGYFGFSTRIVLVPLGIISNSLQQIFYKEIVDRNNSGDELYFYLLKIYKRLALFAIIPHTIFYLLAPSLFVFFFGEEWRIAGNYTQYLIPWLFLVFLNSPLSSIYIVKGKQKEYFIYEIFLLVSRGISLFIGCYFFKDPNTTIFLYGLVGFLFNAFLIWYYLRISKN